MDFFGVFDQTGDRARREDRHHPSTVSKEENRSEIVSSDDRSSTMVAPTPIPPLFATTLEVQIGWKERVHQGIFELPPHCSVVDVISAPQYSQSSGSRDIRP